MFAPRGLKTLFLLVLSILVLACASPSIRPSQTFHQSFGFQNNGKLIVKSFSIEYGYTKLPHHSDAILNPDGIGVLSEGFNMHVPRSITITWTTKDGDNHKALVPLYDLVKSRGDFRGCKFVFIDDQVEIHMVKKTKKKFINLKGKRTTAHDITYETIYRSAQQPIVQGLK